MKMKSRLRASAKTIVKLEEQKTKLVELITHCWNHRRNDNCGWHQMTADQKELMNSIIYPADAEIKTIEEPNPNGGNL